jgi:acyl carrier protein
MNSAEIKTAVLDILGGIAPDENLSDLDSMDFLDIVMELRKRYRVNIPEDDYVELASMSSTVQYLEPLMRSL